MGVEVVSVGVVFGDRLRGRLGLCLAGGSCLGLVLKGAAGGDIRSGFGVWCAVLVLDMLVGGCSGVGVYWLLSSCGVWVGCGVWLWFKLFTQASSHLVRQIVE